MADDSTKAKAQDTKAKAQEFLQGEIAKMEATVKRLTDDNKAIREEFANCTDKDIVKKTRSEIRGRMADALQVIDTLLVHGSDGIRLSASKYIIDRGLDPDKVGSIDEEAEKLNKLLSELRS